MEWEWLENPYWQGHDVAHQEQAYWQPQFEQAQRDFVQQYAPGQTPQAALEALAQQDAQRVDAEWASEATQGRFSDRSEFSGLSPTQIPKFQTPWGQVPFTSTSEEVRAGGGFQTPQYVGVPGHPSFSQKWGPSIGIASVFAPLAVAGALGGFAGAAVGGAGAGAGAAETGAGMLAFETGGALSAGEAAALSGAYGGAAAGTVGMMGAGLPPEMGLPAYGGYTAAQPLGTPLYTAPLTAASVGVEQTAPVAGTNVTYTTNPALAGSEPAALDTLAAPELTVPGGPSGPSGPSPSTGPAGSAPPAGVELPPTAPTVEPPSPGTFLDKAKSRLLSGLKSSALNQGSQMVMSALKGTPDAPLADDSTLKLPTRIAPPVQTPVRAESALAKLAFIPTDQPTELATPSLPVLTPPKSTTESSVPAITSPTAASVSPQQEHEYAGRYRVRQLEDFLRQKVADRERMRRARFVA